MGLDACIHLLSMNSDMNGIDPHVVFRKKHEEHV